MRTSASFSTGFAAGAGEVAAGRVPYEEGAVEALDRLGGQAAETAALEHQVEQPAVGLAEQAGGGGGIQGAGGVLLQLHHLVPGLLQQPGLFDRNGREVGERTHQRHFVRCEVPDVAVRHVQGPQGGAGVPQRDGHDGVQALGLHHLVDDGAVLEGFVVHVIGRPERGGAVRGALADAPAGQRDGEPDGQRGGVAVGRTDPGALLFEVVEAHPGHVEPEEQPGPAGDHLQEFVEVVRQGQVACGVHECGEAGLALLAANEERPDAETLVPGPGQLGEGVPGQAGLTRFADHVVEGSRRRLSVQQFQHFVSVVNHDFSPDPHKSRSRLHQPRCKQSRTCLKVSLGARTGQESLEIRSRSGTRRVIGSPRSMSDAVI